MRLRSRLGSRGSVVVLSLWIVVILAFLAIGLAQSVQQKILVFQRLSSRIEAKLAYESVLKRMITQIRNAPMPLADTFTGSEWYADSLGKPQRFITGHVTQEVTVRDENSKININKSDHEVLTNLFLTIAGLDGGKAGQLADAVIDFRDPDDYVTGEGDYGGSEEGIYRQAGFAYGPKNGDFELIGELLLVKGMTKDIYSIIRDYITIYGSGRLNVNTCDRQTLHLLDLLPSVAEKIMDLRDGSGPNRGEGAHIFRSLSKIGDDLSRFYEMTQEETESLRHAVLYQALCVASDTFRMEGRVWMDQPKFSGDFACVYSTKDGVRYWAET